MRISRLNRNVAPLVAPISSRGFHFLSAPGRRLRPALIQPRGLSLQFGARLGAGVRNLFIQTETTPNADVDHENPVSTTPS